MLYHGSANPLQKNSDSEFELEKMAYKHRKYSDEKILHILDSVYKKMNTAYKNGKPKEFSLSARRHKRYLREPDAGIRLRHILGKNIKRKIFKFIGVKILNPLNMLDRLVNKRIRCMIGPIHGDLHPRNVIVDDLNEVHLIDFAWASVYSPILFDFVLLENSLRFLSFPKLTNPHEQSKVDKLLLNEKGYLRIQDYKFSTEKKQILYRRLALIIEKIRGEARKVAYVNNDFTEYLLVQFIVLYGLLRYDEYADYRTICALGLIANKLNKCKSFKKLLLTH